MHKLCKLLILFTSIFTVTIVQAGDLYQIDPVHSSVSFEVPHLVISSVEGKFTDFNGTIEFADNNFESSKVEAAIKTQSINTNNEKRDNHLRSKDFFEVSKFSTMNFISQKIVGKKDNFVMIGHLTIKGVKKSVKFDTKYLGSVTDGYGNLKVAFLAKTKINRKDYGLMWNSMVEAGPVVGDEIEITLKIQAAKVMPKNKKVVGK
ncbi:MAG: YceI family protein [Bdellovibrionales bacterium]|nr:YceI family protein [Bdellovibrionales bacterium]